MDEIIFEHEPEVNLVVEFEEGFGQVFSDDEPQTFDQKDVCPIPDPKKVNNWTFIHYFEDCFNRMEIDMNVYYSIEDDNLEKYKEFKHRTTDIALHMAAFYSTNIAIFMCGMANASEITEVSDAGNSVMSIAIQFEKTELLRYILGNFDIDYKDYFVDVISTKNMDIIKMFLEKIKRFHSSYLCAAIDVCREDIFDLIMDHFDIKNLEFLDVSVLFGLLYDYPAATIKERISFCIKCIELGAPVSGRRGGSLSTILHKAIYLDNKTLVRIIVEKMDNIHISNYRGRTPLDLVKSSKCDIPNREIYEEILTQKQPLPIPVLGVDDMVSLVKYNTISSIGNDTECVTNDGSENTSNIISNDIKE